MIAGMRLAVAAAASVWLTACAPAIPGTPTWPGATLEQVLLTGQDFGAGVRYDRIVETPGQPDGAGGAPAMLSKPAGCANGLTDVIANTAERGPGSAAKYTVGFDGARIVMTVLSWRLDLELLAATAKRCEYFEAFFDAQSEGIPITTTKLPSGEDTLAYRQTMQLRAGPDSVYMSFANIGSKAVMGVAFPTADPSIAVKATLPQTFLDIVDSQIDRIRS